MLRTVVSAALLGSAWAAVVDDSVRNKPWFEARSAHFLTYSCGATQEVARLTARLEQFRQAYALLAGTQAVASPPVIVMAFPDHPSLRPYLPLYQDRPANLAAFFVRGTDENLIVTSLSALTSEALDNVFHEYAHLLLRRNDRVWPAWLKEGMADFYATFEVAGSRVRIGHERPAYLRLLRQGQLLPLQVLLGVGRDSPEYNEQERQGIFYAQSWLLTHYLVLGRNAALRTRLADYTKNLRAGAVGAAAFTNTFGISLAAMEDQLREYLKAAKYDRIELALPVDLSGARGMTFRPLSKTEVCFRLGSQLLRIDRAKDAEALFLEARSFAPGSPLPEEGLGLIAADREQAAQAVEHLGRALAAGSSSYIAHYLFARETLRLTSHGVNSYTRLEPAQAQAIREALEKSLTLMPEFGPSHHLLGFLETIQREHLDSAEAHLRRALQLEPENEYYLLTLAQAQLARQEPKQALDSLRSLQQPFIDARVRAQARQLLTELEGHPANTVPKR